MATNKPGRNAVLATWSRPVTEKRGAFRNARYTDFSKPQNIKKMKAALAKVRKELGREYPLVLGEREIMTEDRLNSMDPARPEVLVGSFAKAAQAEAEIAIQAATETYETWKWTDAWTRATYAWKAADLMKKRRLELAAWMVFEVSKSWAEADADVAEAIDFLEFYGREAVRYGGPQPLTPLAGEDLELRYVPIGPVLVVPPWNFPLAILTGMATAAWVAGNTVILKPSSDSPAIGYQYFKILQEIGLPAGVVNFMPGAGAKAGDYLVAHPKTRMIAFTGSMDVGLRIQEVSSKRHPECIWIKRTLLEMGGKDGIIVDSEADLDAAAEGVMRSAFGFQGQKCSACSRVMVVADVYDAFIARLLPLVSKIKIGPPDNPKNFMGAVINEGAMRDQLNYIEIGKQEGVLIAGGGRDTGAGSGWFVQPTVFKDIPPRGRLAQEEIFGPVLAIIKAQDYDDALEIANNTIYGLTGAIYTKNPEKIKQGKDRFHCGNLYLNRKCTGAMVGAHPFGGFNMSGTDSKAGGRDYLLLFTQPKSIAENLKAKKK
jgi:1-pyrroline-5-carboxylate dehydrogenase